MGPRDDAAELSVLLPKLWAEHDAADKAHRLRCLIFAAMAREDQETDWTAALGMCETLDQLGFQEVRIRQIFVAAIEKSASQTPKDDQRG